MFIVKPQAKGKTIKKYLNLISFVNMEKEKNGEIKTAKIDEIYCEMKI